MTSTNTLSKTSAEATAQSKTSHPKNPRSNAPSRLVSIVGTGSYTPDKVLTNAQLVQMVDTTEDWIVTRTGIHERRIAPPDLNTSDMAARAALRALENAHVKPEEVDLIIVGTATPDMLFPSTACLVQHKIGAKKAACFDMEAACAGFLYASEIGAQFIASGTFNTVLVIGAEKLSSVTNWKDRATCVLFGDGAGAAVLRPGDAGHVIWTSVLGADGSQTGILNLPAGGSAQPATHATVDADLHFLKMEGPELFKQAIIAMGRAAREALKRCDMTAADISLLIPHQANLRIMQSLAERMGIPSEKVVVTINKYGNTSAASVIVALDEVAREGRLKKGDFVLMVVFGAGLTWAASIVQW